MSTFLSAFGGNTRTSEEDNQYNFYNYNNSFSANRSLTGSTQESIFANKDGKHLSWIPGRYSWQRRFSEPTRRGVHDRQHIITLRISHHPSPHRAFPVINGY